MQKDFALSRKLQALREKTVLGNSPRYGRSRFVAIFLGVDGGGTKTTCVVGNEDSLLATATAGGSNVVRLGEEQARKSLHEAIHRACEAARIELSAVQRISVGMAGAGRPQIGDVGRRVGAEDFSCHVLVSGGRVIP